MYARLNPAYGWTWKGSEFILSDTIRYAGMFSGRTPDGRVCARPLIEFDALSHDGISWKPVHELREMVPWEVPGVR